MNGLMIEAIEVSKTFGSVAALDRVSVSVPQGSVLALLGHNGAGKTTLVNVLTTLLPATSGTARVAGFDVLGEAHEVRRRIGLTGQFAAVDERLSGQANLELIARLLGASPAQSRRRAGELLELFDLVAAARRPARTYSGGMRRRLDLAASLVGSPDVIFLDEPTSGLDPTARLAVWEIVEELVGTGTTVMLTTQYLDEADRLADSISLLSAGRVVASGTPQQLKSDVGRRTVTATFADPADLPAAAAALVGAGLQPVTDPARATVTTPVDGSRDLAVVVRALDDVQLEASELSLAEPTLDDVYLALTSRAPAA